MNTKVAKLFLCLFVGVVCFLGFSTTVHAETTSDGFEYTYDDWYGTMTITGYSGTKSDITIPSTIDGKEVTQIYKYAFSGNSTITSVVIPDTVTYIGEDAFTNCSNLNSVTLSKNLTNVNAAYFSMSDKLTKIIVPEDSEYFCTYKDLIYTKDMKKLVCVPAGLDSVSIYPGVETIGISAFYYNSKISTIFLPEGLTTIESYAFLNMAKLQFVYIPDSVTEIGNGIINSHYFVKKHLMINNNDIARKYAKENNISVSVSCVYAFRATNGPTSVSFRWEPYEGASGYYLYQYNFKTKKYARIRSISKNKVTYKLTGLSASTKYKFALVPYFVNGDETHELFTKAIITITTLPKPYPKKVTNFQGSYSKGKNVLTWDAVPNATGYTIYRYNAKTKSWARIKRTKNVSYTDKKAGKASIYKYKIKAYTVYDGKTYYGKKETVLNLPALASVTSCKYSFRGNDVYLTWDKVSGADGYRISYTTWDLKAYVKHSKTNELKLPGTIFSADISPYKVVNGKKYYCK